MKKLLYAALAACLGFALYAPPVLAQSAKVGADIPTNSSGVPALGDCGGQYCLLTSTGGGGGGAGTEYTEDAAAAANPVGQIMIGRRRDTLTAAEVGADGDNIAINFTSKGQMHVYSEVGSSALPTGAATAANQSTEITSLSNIDTDLGAAADTVCATDNGTCSLAALIKRTNARLTSLLTGPVPVSDNAGSLTVDGTVAATQSGTWNVTNISGTVSLPTGAATETTLATLSQSQGSTTSGQKGHLVYGAVTTSAPTYTTAQSSPLSLDTTGGLRVNCATGCSGSASLTPFAQTGTVTISATTASARAALANSDTVLVVPNPGSVTLYVKPGNSSITAATTDFAIPPGMVATVSVSGATHIAFITASSSVATTAQQGTGTPNYGVFTDFSQATQIKGQTASGAAIANPPVTVGGRASSTVPTAVDDGDVVDVRLDLYGNTVTWPYAARANLLTGLTTAMTGTTSTAVTGMGAPGAGLFNYVTTLACGNSHASVGTFVELQDGSGGTTFFTIPAAAVYGGAVLSFPSPLKQPTANTALYVKDTTTGANVICSVVGFKAP